MLAKRCRRRDSVNLRKNGHTPSGQQTFHCQDCHAYGTLDTKEQERGHKQATVEKLHLERRLPVDDCLHHRHEPDDGGCYPKKKLRR